jgi:hypothetical protein
MKSPGTHTDDDTSQQPRQETTPTKPEKSAIDKEDHTAAREKLADEERVSKKSRSSAQR